MKRLSEISQKELGSRLLQLRNSFQWSQDDLGKEVGLSRSSISLIESGSRAVSALELHRFSQVFQMSCDSLLADDFKLYEVHVNKENEVDFDNSLRISIPELKVNHFKNVLLYILKKCGGKPNIGETVLYKLLYFIDFNYYEVYEEHLTGATYKKLPFGPVPQKLKSIIKEMRSNHEIEVLDVEYHGYKQKKYLALESPNLKDLTAAEIDIIDKVINQFSDWNASSISDYSHNDMPWKATESGQDIDYELVFYREAPYSARVYDN